MAKYSKKMARRIFDLIRKDSYTIAEICAGVGINQDSFYRWQRELPEFKEGVQSAREHFVEDRLVECEKSLVKLINGYDYEEIKTVMTKNAKGEPAIKERTVTTKHIVPSLPAIIHFQTNRDPENWKNRQSTELTGKDGKDLFEGITDEELEARITELEKKLAK
jgi:transposase-like protein